MNATDGTIMEKQDLTEHVGSEVTLKNSFQVAFNVPVEKAIRELLYTERITQGFTMQ